jgi:hypothetical protein
VKHFSPFSFSDSMVLLQKFFHRKGATPSGPPPRSGGHGQGAKNFNIELGALGVLAVQILVFLGDL